MTNLLSASYTTTQLIRRELEDVFDEFAAPLRMRRDVDRVLEQGAPAMWTLRMMDQILDEYMTPPALRIRIERAFERALSFRNQAAREFYGRSTSPDGWSRAAYEPYARSFNDGYRTASEGWIRGYGDGYLRTGLESAFSYGAGYALDANPFGRGNLERIIPNVEVIERETEIVVRAELTGVREQDVDTRITEDGVLTIRAYRRDGVYTRNVALPRGAVTTAAQAVTHAGVLEVRVPRADFGRTRRVPVTHTIADAAFRTNGIAEQRLHVS
jgi:HSP20 family molecular chaperone IbpA